MFKITAIIDEVRGVEHIDTDGGGFDKQEVVLRIDPQNEKQKVSYLLVELAGKQAGSIDSADVGRKGDFGFYLNGNKGTGKYADRIFMRLRYAGHKLTDDVPVPVADETDELAW